MPGERMIGTGASRGVGVTIGHALVAPRPPNPAIRQPSAAYLRNIVANVLGCVTSAGYLLSVRHISAMTKGGRAEACKAGRIVTPLR
jgi:hypothetical protein